MAVGGNSPPATRPKYSQYPTSASLDNRSSAKYNESSENFLLAMSTWYKIFVQTLFKSVRIGVVEGPVMAAQEESSSDLLEGT